MTDDDHWDLYADAVIDCEIDGARRWLSGADAGELPATPLFVLTAHNPRGIERDRALNEADERRLEQELTAMGLEFLSANGRSVDAPWSEPGVAIAGIDRAQACDLGSRYGQLAIYELTADDAHVVRCIDRKIVRTRTRRR